MASRQNGVRDQVSHSLENSKLQDLIVYTDGSVTEDQSGWRFTVKQGHCGHHPWRQCSRSQPPAWQYRWRRSPTPSAGLPQEVTVRPHAIILTDSMSLLQKVISDVCPPVWNLRAVIWFPFPISSLVFLPSPLGHPILSFFCEWSILLNFFLKKY